MTLIRLVPPGDAAARSPQEPDPNASPLSPEIITDILWGVALPSDGLEHVRARPGPERRIDVVIFHRTDPVPEGRENGLALCQRAIDIAPALKGWTAHLLPTRYPHSAG
jgi:hypothetical protein